MFRAFGAACVLQAAIISIAQAAGPFGSINVGVWKGGDYTNDATGKFSHCAAGAAYASGVSLIVSQTATNSWLVAFANQAFHYNKGDTLPIDVTFDGQTQARLFGTADSPILVSAIMPPNVLHVFQKSSLMVAVAAGKPFQFNLTSTAPLLAALANCVNRVKTDGIDSAGDFAKAAAAKSETQSSQASPKSQRS